MTFDGKAFGEELVDATKAYLERALEPMRAQLEAAHKHIEELQKTLDLRELAFAETMRTYEIGVDYVAKAIESIPTAEQVAALVKTPTIEEIMALVPVPKDGIDGKDGEKGEPGKDGADGKDGTDGKEGAPGSDGEKGLDGKDGESVTLEQLLPIVDETVAKRVAEVPMPKDGVGLAGGMINRSGELSLTLTDGKVVELGMVVGEDGNDGLGFDDIEMIDNGLTCTIAFKRGDQVKAFEFAKPTLADAWQGVWKAGPYRKGQAVTWGGSLWIAMADTEARPETDDSWKLAVKRGRDGKDPAPLEPKPPKTVKL